MCKCYCTLLSSNIYIYSALKPQGAHVVVADVGTYILSYYKVLVIFLEIKDNFLKFYFMANIFKWRTT